MCAVKMKLKIEAIGFLANHLQPNEMGIIYLMGMGMTMPNEVTKQDLIRVISVICKKLKWIEDEEDIVAGMASGQNLGSSQRPQALAGSKSPS